MSEPVDVIKRDWNNVKTSSLSRIQRLAVNGIVYGTSILGVENLYMETIAEIPWLDRSR
jgi:hypothetical protein